MQFQPGETVNAKILNMTVLDVHTDANERPWVRLQYTMDDGVTDQLYLPIAEPVEYWRHTPADGVPEPGELWADQVGNLYVARYDRGKTRLVDVDTPDSFAANFWNEVHTGEAGPIYRVAERPTHTVKPVTTTSDGGA